MTYVIAALYHFADLPNHEALKAPLQAHCRAHQIQGTLLLASEGINGTIAGSRQNIDATLAYLRNIEGLAALEHKESASDSPPFFRLKVKLRNEIVTMGVQGVRPAKHVGTYVEPEDWNELIHRDDVVLVDTRNDFEYRVGHFKRAIDPNTAAFTEFPKYVDDNLSSAKNKKIAMYCTGGIRCEKATSHLLDQGYEEVFHLKGGILKYLERIPETESAWEGECFVFDRRVSVGHGLQLGSFRLCHGCQSPLSVEQRNHRDYVFGITCEYCCDTITEERRAALEMRISQMKLSETRGEHHLGIDQEEIRARRVAKEAIKNAERARQGHTQRPAHSAAPHHEPT